MTKRIHNITFILTILLYSSNLEAQVAGTALSTPNDSLKVIELREAPSYDSSKKPAEKDKKNKPYIFVEKMPTFPGGKEAMNEYIRDNFLDKVKKYIIPSGVKIIARFVVEPDGRTTDKKIIQITNERQIPESSKKYISDLFQAMLIMMPRWNPGTQNEKKERVYSIMQAELDEPTEAYTLPTGNLSNTVIAPNGKGYTRVEHMPTFPGGEVALEKYLHDNFFDKQSKKIPSNVRIAAKLVIEPDGRVTNVILTRKNKFPNRYSNIPYSLIKIIESMPCWNPGTQNGKKVRVYYFLPIITKPGEPFWEEAKDFSWTIADDNTTKSAADTESQYPLMDDIEDGHENDSPLHLPTFPGGSKELSKFIKENLNYPETSLKQGIDGQVIVNFQVTKKGNIINITVKRNLNAECDNEAVRIVKIMPKWAPATLDGEIMKLYINVPINFHLPE